MTVTVPDPMPRGAFKIEVRHVSEVSHAKKHHDGEDVLEEDEVEACAMERMLMSMLEGNDDGRSGTVNVFGKK